MMFWHYLALIIITGLACFTAGFFGWLAAFLVVLAYLCGVAYALTIQEQVRDDAP